MKRTISLLSALAFVLVFSGSVFAQQTITASADIVQDLQFDKQSDLNFGQISNSQTTNAVLDPQGTNDAGLGNTNSLGKLEITAANSSSIVIEFSNPSELSDNASTPNTIGFTPDYSGNTTDDAATSTDLNTSSSNTKTVSGSGLYYIYFGGTLEGNDIDGATTGSYDATITATINYE